MSTFTTVVVDPAGITAAAGEMLTVRGTGVGVGVCAVATTAKEQIPSSTAANSGETAPFDRPVCVDSTPPPLSLMYPPFCHISH
jgi:hypothetical protein